MPSLLAETLLDVISAGSDSSTETNTKDSDSSNDEECTNLTKPSQIAKLSEKMAFERPSWPASATDDIMDKSQSDIKHYGAPNDIPGPPSLASDHWTRPSYSRAHAPTHLDPETTALFPFLHASIVTCHVFPDAMLISTFILRALLATTSHNSSATHVRHWILNDHVYLAKMIVLPQARISIFCAEVKERCTAAVALLVNVHNSPTLIADLIERQTTDYNYIFLRRGSSNTLSGPANLSHPYRSTIITSVIRDLFFTEPVPFVTHHQDLFQSHQGANGNVSYEVPKAMVALVSMAYYAALKEWSTGEHKQCDFMANMNLDVYKGHMDSLDRIENTRKSFYLRMMTEIYELAASNFSQTTLPVPALDMNILEFDD
ncbi:hypothetical protein BJY52DRAFT_1192929 [Lactarius psammicola]|nr:hypothetical protein BJY52DRAFT_1192929 [Lactarius psammicola]